jgi:hypothetical protein
MIKILQKQSVAWAKNANIFAKFFGDLPILSCPKIFLSSEQPSLPADGNTINYELALFYKGFSSISI